VAVGRWIPLALLKLAVVEPPYKPVQVVRDEPVPVDVNAQTKRLASYDKTYSVFAVDGQNLGFDAVQGVRWSSQ